MSLSVLGTEVPGHRLPPARVTRRRQQQGTARTQDPINEDEVNQSLTILVARKVEAAAKPESV